MQQCLPDGQAWTADKFRDLGVVETVSPCRHRPKWHPAQCSTTVLLGVNAVQEDVAIGKTPSLKPLHIAKDYPSGYMQRLL